MTQISDRKSLKCLYTFTGFAFLINIRKYWNDLMDTKSMIIYHSMINDFTVGVFP